MKRPNQKANAQVATPTEPEDTAGSTAGMFFCNQIIGCFIAFTFVYFLYIYISICFNEHDIYMS